MNATQGDAELTRLYATLQQIQATEYNDVASYDVLLNLSDEVEYIWSASWSFPKVLYLIARYYGPLHLLVSSVFDTRSGLTDATCHGLLWFTAISGPGIFTTTVDMILVLRMHAFYDGSKKVLIFMSIMMACEFITGSIMELYTSLTDTILTPPAIPSVKWTGCLAYNGQLLTLVAWVPCIIVGFVCVLMTLHKFLRIRCGLGWYSHRGLSPLVHAFVVDGMLYFLLLFVAVMIAALMVVEVHSDVARAGLSWMIVMYSVAGTRMVLNLRIKAKQATSMLDTTIQDVEQSLQFPTVLLDGQRVRWEIIDQHSRDIRRYFITMRPYFFIGLPNYRTSRKLACRRASISILNYTCVSVWLYRVDITCTACARDVRTIL